MERCAYAAAILIGRVYFSAHLVAKQAMDEVDLISRLTWFGGHPEIKVADSCIQLLFERQILLITPEYCVLLQAMKNTLKMI